MEYSDERILEALTRWRDRDWQPERGMDVDETSRADSIVIASLIGQRVRLVFMDNKKAPYGPGEEGAVASVHDDGTVVVDWDRGPNYPPGWSRTAIGGSGSAHHHARGSPMGSSLTRCSASRRATSPCEATTTWCARASKVDASGWSSLTTIIARLSVEEGLPRLTPHGLRHSFATAALRARVPVEVVAARLGNTPAMVQQVYSHVIPADDQAAAQLMGDLYRRDVTTL